MKIAKKLINSVKQSTVLIEFIIHLNLIAVNSKL